MALSDLKMFTLSDGGRQICIAFLFICMIIQSSISAPPQSALESTFNRTQLDNAQRFSNTTYLLTSPIDLHVSIGDTGQFDVYLTDKLEEAIRVTFHCESDACSTFDGSILKSIWLTPEQPRATINFTVLFAGHDVIVAEADKTQNGLDTIIDSNAFVRVRAGHSAILGVLGEIFGWIYFFGWSISFWPQNISNYQRKSVIGLNFDYTLLHFTGFLFYTIFNVGLFFFKTVQEEYEEKFPRSEIPVLTNDVVYAIHASAATSITWAQCMIYERGDQRLSIYGKIFQGAAWSTGGILLVLSIFNVFSWLNFIYYFSYIKLTITGLKYLPQIYFNFRRKSTAGWSIYMIYADIIGGSMSFFQMLTIAYNYNDWKTLIGNLPKLGLAIASIFYDIIFLLQEFVFYPDANDTKARRNKSAKGGLQPPKIASRRSTLKDAGDSHDQLYSMNSSISSLESSIASSAASSGEFITISSTGAGGKGHESSKLGDDGAIIDLNSNLDAIIIRRNKNGQ